jgi:beta-galactosidase
MYPIEARIGASRAMINGDVPFEYVTDSDIRNGLAQRYKVIYMPAILALENDVMEILEDYVKNGGRLVMDMPGAWYDQYTALYPTDEGTVFERIFGATIHDYQKADKNRPNSIGDFPVKGVTAGITPNEAQVLARFSDRGEPAITKHQYCEGTAVLVGYPASHSCFEPGNVRAENKLRDYVLGDYESPISSEGAILYRLAAPEADHYFLLNPGEEKYVGLKTHEDINYKKSINAITREEIDMNQKIFLESHSGKWLRFEK